MKCITIVPVQDWTKGVEVHDSILAKLGETRETLHLALGTPPKGRRIPLAGPVGKYAFEQGNGRGRAGEYRRIRFVEVERDCQEGRDRFSLQWSSSEVSSSEEALVYWEHACQGLESTWSDMSIDGIREENRLCRIVDGPITDSLFVLKTGDRITIHRLSTKRQTLACSPWSKKNDLWSTASDCVFDGREGLWNQYVQTVESTTSYTLMYNGTTLEPAGPDVTADGWVDVQWSQPGLLSLARSPGQLEAGRELLHEKTGGALAGVLQALSRLRGTPNAAHLGLVAVAIGAAKKDAGTTKWTKAQLEALEGAEGVVKMLTQASSPPMNIDWSILSLHAFKIATEAMECITAALKEAGYSEPVIWSWLPDDTS